MEASLPRLHRYMSYHAMLMSLCTFIHSFHLINATSYQKISDGAAAFVLMTHARAKELNVKPLFAIRGFADAARDPVEFTIGE
jgi:acetyl-CoA acetyltransferase